MQAPTPEDETRARNRVSFDGAFGRAYSYWVERPWLGRAVGFALWGGDSKPYYKSMRAIGELPAGAVVADAPCGAGDAFAALSQHQRCQIAPNPDPRFASKHDPSDGAETGGAEPQIAEQSRSWRAAIGERDAMRGS